MNKFVPKITLTWSTVGGIVQKKPNLIARRGCLVDGIMYWKQMQPCA